MRLLAFDQASAVTGFAVLEDGRYVRSGVLDLSRNHDVDNRIKHMMLLMFGTIRTAHPNLVVMEDIQKQNNTATYKMLARIQGALMGYCYENELPIQAVLASSWRKKLGFDQGRNIRRWALKQQAVDYVKEHCNKTVSDDEADAICIAFASWPDEPKKKSRR